MNGNIAQETSSSTSESPEVQANTPSRGNHGPHPTEFIEPETVKPTSAMIPPWVWLVTLVFLAIITGIVGYYAGQASKSNDQIPTPTPTTTVTATITPTATPTVSMVQKTGNVKEFTNSFTLKFTLTVPADVTVTETKISSWNGLLLRKDTKAVMAFNLPYELYESQGYSSITNVASDTITSLKRVRSKKVFANSGSYSFAVAYVTPSSLQSGTGCTEPVIGDATTSPCAVPALAYSSTLGFSAYCSVDANYIKICDQIMKTIQVEKL